MSDPAAAASPERTASIGPEHDRWRFSSLTGFDLTRGAPNTTASPHIILPTTTQPLTLSAASTALVIIDMQNLFLAPAFGRSRESPGHRALHHLTTSALPAARAANVRVIWLNWGLTQADLDAMPPGVSRIFGFVGDDGVRLERNGEEGATRGPGRRGGGLGSDCGVLRDPETGVEVAAGQLLMAGEWNTELFPPLDAWYAEGRGLGLRPDLWVHKNRMSGLWGARTELEEVLEREKIRTLLFAGVNTDQCVGGTLTDAFSKGYDCVLLRDGCGTSSPEYSQQCFEFNAAGTWGFLSSCEALKDAVDRVSQ